MEYVFTCILKRIYKEFSKYLRILNFVAFVFLLLCCKVGLGRAIKSWARAEPELYLVTSRAWARSTPIARTDRTSFLLHVALQHVFCDAQNSFGFFLLKIYWITKRSVLEISSWSTSGLVWCCRAAVSYFYDYRYLYSQIQIQSDTKKYFALECFETAVFLQAVSKLFRLFVDRMQNRF